eukprot:GHVU01035832.1.p1 GENE.GHVU01035832.1~~GHVU01035832.1.p1  ORF type:complete len:131 (+),score=4.93 GHVU01035832.1:380-772(+)
MCVCVCCVHACGGSGGCVGARARTASSGHRLLSHSRTRGVVRDRRPSTLYSVVHPRMIDHHLSIYLSIRLITLSAKYPTYDTDTLRFTGGGGGISPPSPPSPRLPIHQSTTPPLFSQSILTHEKMFLTNQ